MINLNAGIVDLRQESSAIIPTQTFYVLKDLGPGEKVELIFPNDPALIMESVALQLRHKILWDARQEGDAWHVRALFREDIEARHLIDLLMRDHERLHKAFANAMHLCNAGKTQEARPHLRQFGQGLRRHLYAEDQVLTPALAQPRDPQGCDPNSMMLQEHGKILEEVRMLESFFEDGDEADASLVSPFFALLSGSLAKHESREESDVFKHWQRTLKVNDSEETENTLFARVAGILQGAEDEAISGL